MARIAILSRPDAGHLIPLGSLGIELARRGHEVTVIAQAGAGPIIAQLQLPFRKLQEGQVLWPNDSVKQFAFGLFGLGGLNYLRSSFAWIAEDILLQGPPILKELGIEGVVVDQTVAGGGTAAQRAGLPFVTVSPSPPLNEDSQQPPSYTSWSYEDSNRARRRNRLGYAGWRWFTLPTLRVINRYRKAWGLIRYASLDESYSSLAQISQLFPEFDFPRSAMPRCFHYVGSLSADRPSATEGFPWERLDGRPLIYASLGTVAVEWNRRAYTKIAAACQGLSAQLVVVRGKWDEKDQGRESTYDLPGDPLVVDFAPQLALLDRAAVAISHGGLNTVLEAISRGVPQVAMPRNDDQPGNAARIVRAGAGLSSPFYHGTPQELRAVIARVLGEEHFRRRAQELCKAMRVAGMARRAAEIAEQALLTRQPVIRGQGVEVRK